MSDDASRIPELPASLAEMRVFVDANAEQFSAILNDILRELKAINSLDEK